MDRGERTSTQAEGLWFRAGVRKALLRSLKLLMALVGLIDIGTLLK